MSGYPNSGYTGNAYGSHGAQPSYYPYNQFPPVVYLGSYLMFEQATAAKLWGISTNPPSWL